MKNVYIEHTNGQYDAMWELFGFQLVSNPSNADVIQFTGGADVSPNLYNKPMHPYSHTQPPRDEREVLLYQSAKKAGKPCVGICRGSQFLHVMNGGELVQHCDNHTVGEGHKATVVWMPQPIHVSSTHHQMMYSEDVGDVLMHTTLSDVKETTRVAGHTHEILLMKTGCDIEAMYYPETNDLSFQPHPEFAVTNNKWSQCMDTYEFMINNYVEIK